jgi:hypothetical protein
MFESDAFRIVLVKAAPATSSVANTCKWSTQPTIFEAST